MVDPIKATSVSDTDAPTESRVRDAWWEGYTFALRGIVADDEAVVADMNEQQKLMATTVDE